MEAEDDAAANYYYFIRRSKSIPHHDAPHMTGDDSNSFPVIIKRARAWRLLWQSSRLWPKKTITLSPGSPLAPTALQTLVCQILQMADWLTVRPTPIRAVCSRTRTDLICHVINHDDAMSTSVVTGCDGAEPFLSGCVPLWRQSRFCPTCTQLQKHSAVPLRCPYNLKLYGLSV